jgi:tRNA A37 N6-isopentenylltransferase MiaA
LASLDDLRRELGIAIRQFAKGQLTWFKRGRSGGNTPYHEFSRTGLILPQQ